MPIFYSMIFEDIQRHMRAEILKRDFESEILKAKEVQKSTVLSALNHNGRDVAVD